MFLRVSGNVREPSVHQIYTGSTPTSSRTPMSLHERPLLSPRVAVPMLDEVERRSAIPRSVTYLVHHGKVLMRKRTIEENNIGTETMIEMS